MSSVIVFDVNETLSDLSPLAARFVAVGAPASAASLWFTSVLRDGFALSVAGVRPDFAEVARESLAARLSVTTLDQPLDQAVEHVLGGLTELPVHADVTQGVQDLAAAGFRLVTLSNGGTALGEKLLGDAGLRDHFERLLSVDDAPAWKPSREAYGYAARECGVRAGGHGAGRQPSLGRRRRDPGRARRRVGRSARGPLPRDVQHADVHRRRARRDRPGAYLRPALRT